MNQIERAWPWILRAIWFGVVLMSGRLFGAGVAELSKPVKTVLLVAAWLVWSGCFLATLIAHPLGLVTLRCGALAVVSATVWAAYRVQQSGDHRPALVVAGIGWTVVAAGLALHAETGHFAVNGPAYPNERRFLLRPAAVVQVVVVPLSAGLLVAGAMSGVVLLAAGQWVLGAVLTVLGGVVAVVMSRALYAAARRFVVFVPAGFVLHDLVALREPVLFRRQSIAAVGAAEVDTDALDLTLGAAGLVMEIRFHEKVELTRRVGRDDFREGRSARFLFVPTLPGRMLAEARARGLSATS